MNKITFKINDGIITVNGKELDLPYPVADALLVDDLVIVRMEPKVGEVFNSNIYALSGDCICKWKIEESPHGTEIDKPYTSIYLSPDKRLIAGNWNGVEYIVDLDSGAISTYAFKRA